MKSYPLPATPTAPRLAWVWMAAALVVLISAFVALAPLADVVGWTAIACAAGVVGALAWRNPAAAAPLLAALALRTTAALLHVYVLPLPGTGMDTVTFERLGWEWSQGGFGGLAETFTLGPWLYSWIIAVLYWVGARSELLVQVLNVLLGTLVVFNVFLIARLLWGEPAARRAAWWAACFPALALFSSIILREVWVIYPFTLGMLTFLRWHRSGGILWLAATLGCLCAAALFHFGMVGALAAVLAIVARRTIAAAWRDPARSPVFAVGVVAVIGGALVAAASRIDFVLLSSATEVVAGYAAGTQVVDRTDYLVGLAVSSPADIVWQAPIRFVFFQFMPFPWLVRAAADLFGMIDAGLYFLLVLYAWRARRDIRSSPAARSLLWVWAASVLVYGLLVSNYGTAIRHRGKMAPVLIAVAAAGMPRRLKAVE